MYVILIQYKNPEAQLNSLKPAHKEYLEEQVGLGHFITAGGRTPANGEVILSCLQDMEFLHDLLQKDPIYNARICQYEIIEFNPEMSFPYMEEILQRQD
jgi:uncharacterized protein YciI